MLRLGQIMRIMLADAPSYSIHVRLACIRQIARSCAYTASQCIAPTSRSLQNHCRGRKDQEGLGLGQLHARLDRSLCQRMPACLGLAASPCARVPGSVIWAIVWSAGQPDLQIKKKTSSSWASLWSGFSPGLDFFWDFFRKPNRDV